MRVKVTKKTSLGKAEGSNEQSALEILKGFNKPSDPTSISLFKNLLFVILHDAYATHGNNTFSDDELSGAYYLNGLFDRIDHFLSSLPSDDEAEPNAKNEEGAMNILKAFNDPGLPCSVGLFKNVLFRSLHDAFCNPDKYLIGNGEITSMFYLYNLLCDIELFLSDLPEAEIDNPDGLMDLRTKRGI